MAKISRPSIPKDDDFIHQYGGGGVPQYATKSGISDQNAEAFQRQMASKEANSAQVPKVSPQEMVNVQNQMNQVHPELVQPMHAPAPENFGPPKITSADADNQTQFGPPGSNHFEGMQEHFGPPKTQVNQSAQTTQNQVNAAKKQTQQNTSPSSLGAPAPDTTNAPNGAVGASSGSSGDKTKKKASYKSVEKMEVDNMLQNAMSHMKIKDPDPQAWN